MSHTRVIYTNSTSAECSTILKQFNFEEDAKKGWYFLPDGIPVKAWVVWGRTVCFPEAHGKLDFSPRVQMFFRSKEARDRVDFYLAEAIMALRALDPLTVIRAYDAESGTEIES
jgi:hypothetical protein